MNKSLIVATQESNINQKITKHTAIVKLFEEKWELLVTLREDDLKTEREAAQIKICTGNPQICFAGTIQDIMAIPAIISNARKELMVFAENCFPSKQHEAEILDTIQELDHLLSLFKKQ